MDPTKLDGKVFFEATIPGYGVGTCIFKGCTPIEATLSIIPLPGAAGPAKMLLKEGLKEAAQTSKTYYRSMSRAELEAVKNSGMLRGGKPGDTFFTDSRFRSADRAADRLSLQNKPEVQVEFRITNNPLLERDGTRVVPEYGGRGGGREFMTKDPVYVEIINAQPY